MFFSAAYCPFFSGIYIYIYIYIYICIIDVSSFGTGILPFHQFVICFYFENGFFHKAQNDKSIKIIVIIDNMRRIFAFNLSKLSFFQIVAKAPYVCHGFYEKNRFIKLVTSYFIRVLTLYFIMLKNG